MLCPQDYLKKAGDIQQPTLQSCQAKFNSSSSLPQLAAATSAATPRTHAPNTVPTHTQLPQKRFLLLKANTSNITSPLKHVGRRRGALNIAFSERDGRDGVQIPVGARDFSPLANVQTDFGDHTACKWYRGVTLGVKWLGSSGWPISSV